MIECVLSWSFLLGGLIYDNQLLFVASAVFAVATQISRIVDRMDGESK